MSVHPSYAISLLLQHLTEALLLLGLVSSLYHEVVALGCAAGASSTSSSGIIEVELH